MNKQELSNEQISKFKTKLFKKFSESNDFDKTEDIKTPFIMSDDNIFGIEIKNNQLKYELIHFFNSSTTNNINLSFADGAGSFFDISLLKYCIDLINIFQNKNSQEIRKNAIYLNVGYNKPIVLENEYIKIYLANKKSDNIYE